MEKRPSQGARAALGVARITSGAARLLSGRRFLPVWGIVYHRGRRSGRRLAAPVAIRATPDGFIIALPFAGAQWFRNVLAAGECAVRWKGIDYAVVEPRLVDWAAARPSFNPIQRAILDRAGVDRFLKLRNNGKASSATTDEFRSAPPSN
jgi:deazaflavin-dependent oxidoreductase (nitroreductase family)